MVVFVLSLKRAEDNLLEKKNQEQNQLHYTELQRPLPGRNFSLPYTALICTHIKIALFLLWTESETMTDQDSLVFMQTTQIFDWQTQNLPSEKQLWIAVAVPSFV